MKINVLEQQGARKEERTRIIPAVYDESGNMISDERREKYIVEVPVMKAVTREESGIIDVRTPLQIKEDRIVELKTMLFDTDYKAIKYAEGLISEEEYEIIKRQRQAWRDEINMLEEGGV